MIRVFLADDHGFVRVGVRKLLDDVPGITVVGEARDGRQVLLAEGKETWDILVLDISLPRVGGIEVLRRMRALAPGVRVIVLSMYPEDQYALRLLGEGAAAYLSKDRPPEELLEAIRRIVAGGTYVSPGVREQASVAGGEAGRPLHESLSAREHQVFTMLFEGRTPSDIAAELDISISTVSNHTHKIKEKLRLGSIGEIVRYAHRAGLIGETSAAEEQVR